MYKHIFKEQRHNSINFDNQQLMLDSQIDFSDVSGQLYYNKARDSSMSKKTYKSRQGTADLAHYNTEMKKHNIQKKVLSILELERQGRGIILGVTCLLTSSSAIYVLKSAKDPNIFRGECTLDE